MGERVLWLYWSLYWVMLRSSTLRKSLEEETFNCPRCDGKLRFKEEEATYICRDCKHKFPPPPYWCYHCLSQQEMDYIETTDEFVCRRCGATRYTRWNSIINSPVADPQLSPRCSPWSSPWYSSWSCRRCLPESLADRCPLDSKALSILPINIGAYQPKVIRI